MKTMFCLVRNALGYLHFSLLAFSANLHLLLFWFCFFFCGFFFFFFFCLFLLCFFCFFFWKNSSLLWNLPITNRISHQQPNLPHRDVIIATTPGVLHVKVQELQADAAARSSDLVHEELVGPVAHRKPRRREVPVAEEERLPCFIVCKR